MQQHSMTVYHPHLLAVPGPAGMGLSSEGTLSMALMDKVVRVDVDKQQVGAGWLRGQGRIRWGTYMHLYIASITPIADENELDCDGVRVSSIGM